jgi:enoyl-CoA hydratase/carnithine racemase
MISQRKLQANRANAGASTGPKSAAGKRRSARNARRHGLAVPVWSDVKLAAKAEQLASAIAGPHAPAALLALARPIAEAQIDLARAR